MNAKLMYLRAAIFAVGAVFGVVWVLLDKDILSALFTVLMCLALSLSLWDTRKKRKGV